MKERLVIDGFEADLARVEWGDHLLDLPREWLPKGAQEGDHLKVDARGGHVTFTVDLAATTRSLKRNQAALDALNAKDGGGEVNL